MEPEKESTNFVSIVPKLIESAKKNPWAMAFVFLLLVSGVSIWFGLTAYKGQTKTLETTIEALKHDVAVAQEQTKQAQKQVDDLTKQILLRSGYATTDTTKNSNQ